MATNSSMIEFLESRYKHYKQHLVASSASSATMHDVDVGIDILKEEIPILSEDYSTPFADAVLAKLLKILVVDDSVMPPPAPVLLCTSHAIMRHHASPKLSHPSNMYIVAAVSELLGHAA